MRWSVGQSRTLVGLTAVIALGFAVGVPLVPHSPVELVVFDVVLFNAAPLLAAVLCLRAARRVPEERMVWWGAAAACVLNVAGALVYALAIAPLAEEPFPSLADVFWLAAYPAFVVITLALLRSRVARPQASTWLDGLVGALGVTAVAATVFITPAVTSPRLDALATAANLAYPVADVLLLALLGAVLAVLGARIDGVVAVLCVVLTSKLVGDVLLAAAQAGDARPHVDGERRPDRRCRRRRSSTAVRPRHQGDSRVARRRRAAGLHRRGPRRPRGRMGRRPDRRG
jgi:hypothetical protein